MCELMISFTNLPQDLMNVIYVKKLEIFELIAESHLQITDFKGVSSYQNKGFRFFQLKIGNNIELRNWDSFLSDEEDPSIFIKKINVLKQQFMSDKGISQCMGYTLQRDMWQEISYKGYFDAKWCKSFCQEMCPKSWDELNLLLDYYKGGYYFVDNDIKNEVIQNVHSYDISSSHLSLMARKRYPSEQFEEIKDTNEIIKIMQSNKDSDCWIGEFKFYNLVKKSKLPICLDDYGHLSEDLDGTKSWVLMLNEVDFQWFKQVFKFNELRIVRFYKSTKQFQRKNFAVIWDYLYRAKEAQDKGSFGKQICKLRAELPYGKSITNPIIKDKLVYLEDCNSFAKEKVEMSFPEIQKRILKNKLPFQWGIWTVSYSRLELISTILRIGVNVCVGGDTDSVKFIGSYGVKVIDQINKEIDKEFETATNRNGIIFNSKMGRFQDEGTLKRYKIIGVKWYLIEKQNGEIDVKACGANVKNLLSYLKEQDDPFEMFDVRIEVKDLFDQSFPNREKGYYEIHKSDILDKTSREMFGIEWRENIYGIQAI